MFRRVGWPLLNLREIRSRFDGWEGQASRKPLTLTLSHKGRGKITGMTPVPIQGDHNGSFNEKSD